MEKKGGKIIGQGADTCVFKPEVACVQGTERNITGRVAGETYVSRIVEKDEEEHLIQKELYKIIKNSLRSYGKEDYLKYFLFGASYCKSNATEVDFREDPASTASYEDCRFSDGRIISRNQLPNRNSYKNIITPVYTEDLVKNGLLTRSQQETRTGIYELMKALTYTSVASSNTESLWAHCDNHFGNIGWKENQIVLTDWGRARIGEDVKEIIKVYRSYHRPQKNQQKISHLERFAQHLFQIKLLGMLPAYTFKSVASIWDILGLLGSAIKYKLVSKRDGGKFFTVLKNNINLLVKKIDKRDNDYTKITNQIEATVAELATIPTPAPNVRLEKKRTKLQDLQTQLKNTLQTITNTEVFNLAYMENVRTAIDNLFNIAPPPPLQQPATEPPYAFSENDLANIQADLFQGGKTRRQTNRHIKTRRNLF